MQLFKIIDGAYLGFYQGRGGTVFISGYRTVTESQWVCEMVTERYQLPDRFTNVLMEWPAHYKTVEFEVPEVMETRTRLVPEHYEERTETTPAHWGTREYWLEPHIEIQYREVPGHYETEREYVQGHYEERTETTPGHWGTREYWVDEVCWWESKTVMTMTAEGLRPYTRMVEVCEPGHWKEVAVWFPDVTRTYTVWVEGEYKDVELWIPTYTESYEVEIPGCWQERRIWFPDVTRTYKVLVPEHEEEYTVTIPAHMEEREEYVPYRSAYVEQRAEGEWVTKEHLVCGWKDVEVEQPIYSYYGEQDEYDMIVRERGPIFVITGPPEGDKLQLRLVESGDIIDVEAEYLGLTVRNDDNAYTVPPYKSPEATREQELSEEEIEKIKWGD